jgi:hypothetical protein
MTVMDDHADIVVQTNVRTDYMVANQPWKKYQMMTIRKMDVHYMEESMCSSTGGKTGTET